MPRGPAPYGYRHEAGALVPDPAEQHTLEQIKLLRSSALGAVSIAKSLNDAGYLCRGARWHRTTIRRILKRLDGAP